MLEKFYSHLKRCHGWTSVSITTVRFLSALGARRHSRCQRYFRQRGARMHRRVHSRLHLRPARAALMPDVYRVYGADRRDRNVDCLDNAGRKRVLSTSHYRDVFSRDIGRTCGAHVSDNIRRAYVVFLRVSAWNLTLYVREVHPTAPVANYGNITRRVPTGNWMKTLSLFFLQLGPLANAKPSLLARWSHVSREPLENFIKLNAGRLPGELSAKVPAFPGIIRPNCRAILINREGRQLVAVLDERLPRIAITPDDNWYYSRTIPRSTDICLT